MSPSTERELSPHVRDHWEEQGYCVHGEVAVYGKALFVDHVAHTGPCSEPGTIVGIEMKKRADASLRRQMHTLDVTHVVDEMWGVAIATPRPETVANWKSAYDGGRWLSPGLLSWSEEGLRAHATPELLRSRYLKKRAHALLLVPENRNLDAGFPAGHPDHEAITHQSVAADRIAAWARNRDAPFTADDCNAHRPPVLDVYRNPRRTLGTVLRRLVEEGRLRELGREGPRKLYGLPND